MAVRPPLPVPALSRRAKVILITVAAFVALILVLGMLSTLLVDYWWYGETGFTEVFWTTWQTRALMFTIFGVAAAVILVGNVLLAYRLRPAFRPMSAEQQNLERYRVAVEPRRRLFVILGGILAALLAGLSAQSRWQEWLMWSNSTPFGKTDPQFGLDISFYTFELPFYRFVLTFLFAITALAILISAGIHYLYGGIRLNTPGQRFATGARTHLTVLLGVFVLFKAVGYWFDRYDLNFSTNGVEGVTGASNSDVNALLPAKTILVFVAIICALAFFANIIIKNFALPALALALLVLASLVIGTGYPAVYNQFVVKPNQASKEAPYIERNIQATREAYGISDDKVTIKPYAAVTTASASEIRNDKLTIPNARLLDPNVISAVFSQTQQVRNVYSFPEKLDIDRYTVGGKTQDYITAVREIDLGNLSEAQDNWINRHTVYTHGYGFVATPANVVNADGFPEFANNGFDPGAIKVDQPRVYYGELFPGSDGYSIVGKTSGADKEFDRPAGNDSTNEENTTYSGKGGVSVDSFFRQTVFAIYYRERNFILNSSIGDNSKVLYIRDPRERVEKAAPFIKADGDPYPAVVDGRIKWIVDGYTTSEGYPYSQQESLGEATQDSLTGTGTTALPDDTVNYIRNSVKATVDAYDGTVTLYAFDDKDPVLKTWMKAYPGTVKAKSEISDQLAAHFRYPEDLFKVQRSLLARYHVKDPGDFYSANDFWKVPSDPTTSTQDDQPPYYVLSQIPGEETATFKLTSALSALRKDNLTAYVAAGSDPGNYGKITVLQTPASSNIPGPNQVQSQFRSNTTISKELALLDQGGSTLRYGNLLTLPVAGGLLYVEPLYVEGTGSTPYPTLQKVLLNFGAKLAYADNLEDGLNQLFGAGAAQGDGGTPPTTPPDSGSSSPSTPSDLSDVAGANAELQKALSDLDAATKAADYAKIGAAQAAVAAAAAKLDAAISAQESGASTPSGSAAPSSSGSAAPSSSGSP